ncbi:MAG TPA: cell division protein FtsA [Nitrospiraceae bacterium]|jgi:cell division protein FtsA|nr:cell division protein FtsA [Nitrospiraceae bacterium]
MASRDCAGNIAVGLDVGTTKICAIVGRETAGKSEITTVGLSPSAGLRKGVVVDMDLTVSSIQRAVKDASDKEGWQIRSAYVGIAGGHIKSFNGSGAVITKGGTVREEDVEKLMDSAGAVYVPVEREILHVIPAGFRLDGLNGIENPVGMDGERLEGNVHIVTGSVSSVENLVTCCRRAGVDVLDIVLEPLASAESVLSTTEKKRGVVLVDIGGGTTDIALYWDGLLRHTAVLSLGGNHITHDIAVCLGIAPEEAENIKKRYGYALINMADEMPDVLDIPQVNGDVTLKREIPLRYLAEIIQARCEELIGLVKKEMDNTCQDLGKSTIVLTGGTSLLKGIRELTEGIFGLPAKIGIPNGVMDRGIVRSPVFATGVGLVQFGLSHCAQPDLESAGILERMKRWVSGFINKYPR